MFMGEMTELDKRKKVLHLENKHIVSYKHLIIISGKKPLVATINHEISHALNALAEALKVNPKMDSMILPSSSLKAHASKEQAPLNNTSNDRINDATHFRFTETEKRNTGIEIDAYNERLYEIYL